VKNLFERLERGRPPAEEPIPQQVPPAAGKLLAWLQNNWKEPVITTRNICQYGPRPARDRESVIRTAEVLERRGWLVPMKTRRPDAKWWRIAIGD
jgi:hypothetical protein